MNPRDLYACLENEHNGITHRCSCVNSRQGGVLIRRTSPVQCVRPEISKLCSWVWGWAVKLACGWVVKLACVWAVSSRAGGFSSSPAGGRLSSPSSPCKARLSWLRFRQRVTCFVILCLMAHSFLLNIYGAGDFGTGDGGWGGQGCSDNCLCHRPARTHIFRSRLGAIRRDARKHLFFGSWDLASPLRVADVADASSHFCSSALGS